MIDKKEKAILFLTLKIILESVDIHIKPYTCHSKSWSGTSCSRFMRQTRRMRRKKRKKRQALHKIDNIYTINMFESIERQLGNAHTFFINSS